MHLSSEYPVLCRSRKNLTNFGNVLRFKQIDSQIIISNELNLNFNFVYILVKPGLPYEPSDLPLLTSTAANSTGMIEINYFNNFVRPK